MRTLPHEGTSSISEDAVSEAISELSSLFEADGAILRLVSMEESRPRVTLAIDFMGVECLDCVMPAEKLRPVLEAAFNKRAGSSCDVVLLDPREPAPASVPATTVATVQVLDPRGVVESDGGGAGPDAGSLAGKRVGFRIDVLWPAWDLVVDEWSKALREAGAAETVSWRRMQGLTGAEGRAKQAEYEDFLRSVDVAIVGLGNCGGCTAYTVEDSLTALDVGRPTLAVATAHFETLARSLASHQGRPDLRLLILPYPFHTLPEDDVRCAARSLVPSMLDKIGAAV